jgi:hypothetical protein
MAALWHRLSRPVVRPAVLARGATVHKRRRLAAAGHDGCVEDGRPLVWWANSDDPYWTLRHSGGPMVAIALFPAILVTCFAGAHGAPVVALLLLCALVPLATVAALSEYLLDRRAVVELRLAGDELTLIRANRGTSKVPFADLQRVEIVRYISAGDPSSLRMWLHVGERVERTRHGPPDLSERWIRALAAAEVDLQVRDKDDAD